MKTLLLILALSVGVIAQSSPKPAPIKTDSPFGPQGEVEKEDGHIVERGLIDGVEYRIYYRDGSAAFTAKYGASLGWENVQDRWRVRCGKDAMNDHVSCAATRSDLTLIVLNLSHKLLYSAIVGTDNYPRSRAMIRFDAEPPILGGEIQGFAFSDGENIFSRLTKAKMITTRYKEWPSGADVDSSWEVFGAKQVIEYLKWAALHIQ